MLGEGAVLYHHAYKGCLRQRIGGNFNPGAEVENQGIGPANSPSNNPSPLQCSQGVFALKMAIGRSTVRHKTKPHLALIWQGILMNQLISV